MRTAALCVLLAAGAAAAPGRQLRYAESGSRLVYAFVFGHKDTCRVIRRAEAPRFEFVHYARRRWNAAYRGEPGDRIVAEFGFGYLGRPVHLVPTNDARYLIAFANREVDGRLPRLDRVRTLGEERKRPEPLDYSDLPRETVPAWPALARVLPTKKKKAPAAAAPALAYGFVTLEESPGRVIVARQSEGPDNLLFEMICFAVDVRKARIALPEEGELTRLLDHAEPLVRAGAAWALGHSEKAQFAPELKRALIRTTLGAARVEIARAIVRCGDAAGRRTLRALLSAERDVSARRGAALALAQATDRSDADALADALADPDGATADFVALALVRLGKPGVSALMRASHSSRSEVRAAAARALARLADPAAEKRLLALAREGEAVVQTAAAVALTSPPRAICPQNHGDFARALDACRVKRNQKAARRLSILAGHARIAHEKVLEALVDLTASEPKAIWSLKRITGEKLATPEDWKAWWRAR
ncbi:MAG: HEAT repeat domain-containing protein [Planctomycetota bacterium]